MKYLRFLLENSSFPTNHNEPIQQECESCQEDLPAAESSSSTSTSLDSAVELTPDPGTSEEEEIQPPKSCSRFEDNPSGNNKNSSNIHNAQSGGELSSICIDQSQNLLTEPSLNPTVPPSPPDPLNKPFF